VGCFHRPKPLESHSCACALGNTMISLLQRLRRKLRRKKKEQDKPASKSAAQPPPQVSARDVVESKPITSQQNLGPYSVTMAERERYQRVVLGMTATEIQNALPPGQYGIRPIVDRPSRPSGRGDLAYAYMEPA
jgi:hypothetical protein